MANLMATITHYHPNPPMPQQTIEKMQNCHRHCQNAPQHFLTILATIMSIYAPVFDHASPQGVPMDSLECYRAVGAVELVDTPARTLFILYVFSWHSIHNIYCFV